MLSPLSSLKSTINTSRAKMRVPSVVSTSLVLGLLNGEDSNRPSMATHVQAARFVVEGIRLSEDASHIPRAIGVRCGARFSEIHSTFRQAFAVDEFGTTGTWSGTRYHVPGNSSININSTIIIVIVTT